MRVHGTTTAVMVVAVLAACSPADPDSNQEADGTTMQLTSGSFDDGGMIPSRHTCDEADVSPHLVWSDVPDGTKSFALIVEDPDARGFVHWLLINVPGATRELPEGEGDAIGTPETNDFGRSGWGGPCPPSGQHRYVFTLYALPASIVDGTDANTVRDQAESSALARATLNGVYERR